MLESMIKGAGSIHRLNLEGAFPERPPYRPREQLEALKKTALYDRGRGQWNNRMSAEQELEDPRRFAAALLLGALAEAHFSPKAARQTYISLKASPLYDRKRAQWNGHLTPDQQLEDTDRCADAQLLGVLLAKQFNPDAAGKIYQELKESALYDPERCQWRGWISEEQRVKNDRRHSFYQLLGVLAEAQFDKESAHRTYQALKASPLYDSQNSLWNWRMPADQKPEAANRRAEDQLAGVLAEAQFNPEAARELYDRLKAPPWYDPERGLWNTAVTAVGQARDNISYAQDQLLAVLVEAELLKTMPRPLVQAVPPLPATEDW